MNEPITLQKLIDLANKQHWNYSDTYVLFREPCRKGEQLDYTVNADVRKGGEVYNESGTLQKVKQGICVDRIQII